MSTELDELIKIRKLIQKLLKHLVKRDRGADFKASEANP